MKLSDLIQVTDEKGFVTLHEPDEDGNAGDLVFSVWRDDWLSVLRPTDTARAGEDVPIDMVLHCPACGLQHIDTPDLAPVQHEDGSASLWDNPPHRSHLCHGCGHIWRPADVPTNGVEYVQTKGKADSPLVFRATPSPVTDETALSGEALGYSRMASTGRCDFEQLREALAEATTGNRGLTDNWPDNIYPGHVGVQGINYNSLNRIVTAFVDAALASTPQLAAAETVEQAVAAERERCAKICDREATLRIQRAGSNDSNWGDPSVQIHKSVTAKRLATAIRQSAKGGE
ncbi:hypothetical protein EIK56_24950 [Sphingomonas sp. C8-2]|nr:hypothetical protein EIK56_24950 [Sphingomonas sp. C8-2]